jgi:hypothetical protein
MVASLKASTYLVDSADLETTGVALIHDGAGLWSGVVEDLDVVTYAGSRGGTIAAGVLPPFTMSTMFLVQAANYDAVWAAIVALRRRCKVGRTVTLTRRMPDPEGTAANVDHTASARRQADRVSWITDSAAQVDIDWLVADGCWYAASESIAGAGTVTVKGDTSTRAITATLPAGAANPVVTNSTNGYTFRYVGTVPTGGVSVDVRARKATKVSDSSDVSSALKWSKDSPFQLDPGSQTITVSAGTVSFTYLPAYV